MIESAIVLFAHGSREPDWARPFERLRTLVAQEVDGESVELAFLETMPPTLEEAVARLYARGARSIAVVPLFLGTGGHLKRDLPRILEQLRCAHSDLSLRATPALGEIDAVLESIAEWIVKAGAPG
jgi:sirohydrochlorin cobaltochelatase